MKRSRLEIARAVLRLSGETLVPVEQLREKAFASTRAIIRWIRTGRGGVFLDGCHRPGVGWMSSFAALERFFAAVQPANPQTHDAEGIQPTKQRPVSRRVGRRNISITPRTSDGSA